MPYVKERPEAAIAKSEPDAILITSNWTIMVCPESAAAAMATPKAASVIE